jgi:UDP-arabinose 4-epimerase
MTSKHILVTGGAGYIGSHTCKALAQAGYTPVSFDNLSTGHRHAVKWGPLVEGNLIDTDLLCRTLRDYDISDIVHFAANAYVGESMTNPSKYFHNNVVGTLSLLDAIVKTGARQIVFSSTCATYGIPAFSEELDSRITEDTPQHPINPYGETKLMVEKMLKWYAQAHGLKYVALRYFNAAGADPAGEIGEEHDPETHLIPLVLEAAVRQQSEESLSSVVHCPSSDSKGVATAKKERRTKDEEPTTGPQELHASSLRPQPLLKIFGTDYPTPDGTCIRDYIHVTDLADAHLRALDYLRENDTATAINLGTGYGHSVREVIDAASAITGIAIPAVASPRREGDPAVLVAAADKARKLLGWTPRHSDLENIIQTAWQFLGRGTGK